MQQVAGLQGKVQFGTCRHQGELARSAFGFSQDVGPLGRLVFRAGLAPQQRHRLPRQGKECGPSRGVQDVLPALGGLHRVPGAVDCQMRDGAQRREVLDRLVGRAILAKADRVVRHHEGCADPHHGGQADGRAAIVREAQERAAIRDEAAVQRDAVHRRRHAVLAHAVVDVGAPELPLALK